MYVLTKDVLTLQEAATAGLAKEACGTACDASELKVREVEAARDVLPLVEARETSTNSTASTSAQVTSIDAVTFPKVDASVGREACVVACEVTCNSTVLALIQSECLSECVRTLLLTFYTNFFGVCYEVANNYLSLIEIPLPRLLNVFQASDIKREAGPEIAERLFRPLLRRRDN